MNFNIKFDFLGLLQIVLIILKLTGYIAWSWWIVALPTLIPLIITFVLLLIYHIARFYEQRKMG